MRDPNGLEIVLSSIQLISTPAQEYPLKISQGALNCSLDVNLDNRSVALRNPYERAIFKLQEGIVHGMHRFMQDNGFTEIHTQRLLHREQKVEQTYSTLTTSEACFPQSVTTIL